MKNREIKFRVWDTKIGSYINTYNRYLSCCGDIYKQIPDNSIEEIENQIIQQFTGLRGVCGSDIYEGDIVNVNGGNHIIEWRGAGFAATWSDYDLDSCWFIGGGPVVVGNIFENPELAEKARKGPKV